jgi:hypothetical protein
MKIDHAIVTFIAVITIILACAAAPSFERKSEGIDYNNLRGAAKFQAREAVKP